MSELKRLLPPTALRDQNPELEGDSGLAVPRAGSLQKQPLRG